MSKCPAAWYDPRTVDINGTRDMECKVTQLPVQLFRVLPVAAVMCPVWLAAADEQSDARRWRIQDSDAEFRVMDWQNRTEHVGSAGATEIEQWDLQVGHGTYIYLGCPVASLPVINELLLDVNVYSDRPGVQLLARVILPHSLDPQTGIPRQVLLRGPETDDSGRWQRLRLTQLPDLLEARLRVLRSLTDRASMAESLMSATCCWTCIPFPEHRRFVWSLPSLADICQSPRRCIRCRLRKRIGHRLPAGLRSAAV